MMDPRVQGQWGSMMDLLRVGRGAALSDAAVRDYPAPGSQGSPYTRSTISPSCMLRDHTELTGHAEDCERHHLAPILSRSSAALASPSSIKIAGTNVVTIPFAVSTVPPVPLSFAVPIRSYAVLTLATNWTPAAGVDPAAPRAAAAWITLCRLAALMADCILLGSSTTAAAASYKACTYAGVVVRAFSASVNHPPYRSVPLLYAPVRALSLKLFRCKAI